jgi:hypothetical protein
VLDFIGCTIKRLPPDLLVPAARTAAAINPNNHPLLSGVLKLLGGLLLDKLGVRDFNPDDPLKVVTPEHIAVLTSKYWGAKGVKLTVGFLESTPTDLQGRILAHMNAWDQYANVSFTLAQTDPQVRITRSGDGYWSYLGTDILHIDKSQPTMCLQDFTMDTPESEFHRVVRHETGHTLGCVHEHVRQEIVARIDKLKAIIYFGQTEGWTPQETIQQVLTPVSESSLMGTPHAEQDSVMCYQLPGSITTDGKPVVGGLDITAGDGAFMAKMYPPAVAPPSPSAAPTITVPVAGTYQLVK